MNSESSRYYTYILRCSGDLLYTGITNNIKKRMRAHFSGNSAAAKYTRSHTPERLEAVWECADRSLASRLEYRIKRLRKIKKLDLIENNSLSSINGIAPELYRRLGSEEISGQAPQSACPDPKAPTPSEDRQAAPRNTE